MIRLLAGTLSIALLFLASVGHVVAEEAAGSSVTVQVDGALPAKGSVVVALFDSEEAFLKDSIADQTTELSEDGTAVATFEGVAPGVYAISVFHDKNGNGKLNTNFLGIPKEKTGASNNPKARMGPPLFEASKFELGAEPLTLSITVR